MKAVGVPEKCILGKVVESDPPRKLVQTWHPQFTPEMIAESPSRLTWEIKEHEGGFSTLTLTHDTTGAPMVDGMVRGNDEPNKGGGGWPWVLSDLKSLLETGKRMAG
jgi:uncharacterized protein YndB with AHSA1/START domain